MKTVFTPEELHEKQLELEAAMFGNGIERFNRNNQRAIDQGEASSTAWFRRLTKLFIEPCAEAITAYVDYYQGRAGKPSKALTYISLLPPETAAYVALKVIFDHIVIEDLSLQMVAEKIGQRIEDQVRFTKLEACAPKYIERILKTLARANSQQYSHKATVLTHAEKLLSERKDQRYVTDVERWHNWAKPDLVLVGTKLIEICQENLFYKDEPLFVKEVKNVGHGKSVKSKSWLRPSEHLVDWIAEFKDVVGQLSPCYGPCVVPPRDWVGPMAGGYHSLEVSSRLNMVKESDKEHLKRLTRKQMPMVYRAVNKLQSVGWSVASDVLEVASQVLDSNLALGMPQAEPLIVRPAPVPLALQHLRGTELREALTPAQWDAFTEWKQEAAEIYDAERERRAKYIEATRTLKQASAYSAFESIYFVYTLDFRGRIYSQSSLLSPQGGDLQKGLLRFSEGVPLGKTGKYWLTIQGANTFGEDKSTFDERIAFIENMAEDIRDYAANPLLFRGWATADAPYQFLNFCFEYAALLDWEDAGNKAEDFVSYIPVAMDGSCSGIQHYSALLRDPVGGAAVNLVPNDRPQDIYKEVAKVGVVELNRIIEQDGETEEGPKLTALAKAWLNLGFTRGLTKKSVMTLPYGSTQLTCRESVADYLADLTKKEAANARAEGRAVQAAHPFSSDKDDIMSRSNAESLASSVIWGSIGKVVVAARAGMAFIKAVTKEVAKTGQPLLWTTPTGFLVKQAIYSYDSYRVTTTLMGGTTFVLREPTDEIDVRKMASSCAPNYIHSMDASHLTYAVCYYDDASIKSIACIHDSFGAHAGRTEEARALLTASFVDMYESCNWLEKFKDENEDRLLIDTGIEVPEYLGLDLQLIKKSAYCFA